MGRRGKHHRFRAVVNHLDELVGCLDKRPAKRLPECVRDLDALLAEAVETATTTTRTTHLGTFIAHHRLIHRVRAWSCLHDRGDSRRVFESMPCVGSFQLGFLDGTRHNDQPNGLGGDLGCKGNRQIPWIRV